MQELLMAGVLWAASFYLFRYSYKTGKQRLELDKAINEILNEGKK
jgi:hypothetical protein